MYSKVAPPTDANYYTPPEASRIFRAWWSGEADKERELLFAREAMPDVIASGQNASGFVLTHREGGVKFVRAGSALVSGSSFVS